MFDFEEKKKIKNVIYSRISLVVLVILVILVAKSVWFAFRDERLTRINKIEAENKLNELEEREEKLTDDIGKLKTDEGVEKEIRDKFSVVKDGEKMIMIIDSGDKRNNYNQEKSFWKKFLNLFQ